MTPAEATLEASRQANNIHTCIPVYNNRNADHVAGSAIYAFIPMYKKIPARSDPPSRVNWRKTLHIIPQRADPMDKGRAVRMGRGKREEANLAFDANIPLPILILALIFNWKGCQTSGRLLCPRALATATPYRTLARVILCSFTYAVNKRAYKTT